MEWRIPGLRATAVGMLSMRLGTTRARRRGCSRCREALFSAGSKSTVLIKSRHFVAWAPWAVELSLAGQWPVTWSVGNRSTYSFTRFYFDGPSFARVMLVTVSVVCSSSCPITESDICSLSFTREETTRPSLGSNVNSPVPF